MLILILRGTLTAVLVIVWLSLHPGMTTRARLLLSIRPADGDGDDKFGAASKCPPES
jgi:hypothetical protein